MKIDKEKLKKTKLPSSYLPSILQRGFRYLVVGTAGMFVQTWIFLLALWCMGNPEKDSIPYYIAFAIGFILEMIPNYICSNWYTFGTKPNKTNARGFIFSRSVNLVLQFSLFPIMVNLLPNWDNDVLSYGCIFVAGIINFLMLNFFFNKSKKQA